MKKLSLTEATCLALEGKLIKESKSFKFGKNDIEYKNIQDLCDTLGVIIDTYNELTNYKKLNGNTINDEVWMYVYNKIPRPSEKDYKQIPYRIKVTDLHGGFFPEDTKYPIKDEETALEVVNIIKDFCNKTNVDFEDIIEEMGIETTNKKLESKSNIDIAHTIVNNTLEEFNLKLESDYVKGFEKVTFIDKNSKRKFMMTLNKKCKDQCIKQEKCSDNPVYYNVNGYTEKSLGYIYPAATQYAYVFEDKSEVVIISLSDDKNTVKISFEGGGLYTRDFYM